MTRAGARLDSCLGGVWQARVRRGFHLSRTTTLDPAAASIVEPEVPAGGAFLIIQCSLYSSVMAVLTQVDMGTLGRVGIALADPTRRRVLVHLTSGPGYPAEIDRRDCRRCTCLPCVRGRTGVEKRVPRIPLQPSRLCRKD